MLTRSIGDRSKSFSTTIEYSQYVIDQDWKQLRDQPNSALGEQDCLAKYNSLEILESLIPQFVNTKYEDGPFKLICDDFGPANMIVKSEEDLTIVGVVDLEWAYAGPAQLFGSAPWWLLHDRPVNEEWDFKDGNAPQAKDSYFHCLEIFKRVLAKEETALSGSRGTKLSDLISWSEASGAMYAHMLLSAGFFNPFGFPCKQLEAIVGSLWWILRIDEVELRPEVKNL